MTVEALRPKGSGSIHPGTGASHARIWGLGGFRPERVVPNSELVEAIDSSDEWIQERSGIQSRRWAGPNDTVVSMSDAAARDAIAAGLLFQKARTNGFDTLAPVSADADGIAIGFENFLRLVGKFAEFSGVWTTEPGLNSATLTGAEQKLFGDGVGVGVVIVE